MEPQYLTKEVFEVWAQQFDKRLEKVDHLADTVEEHGQEIAVLVDRSEHAERLARNSRGLSGVISAIVAGAISAFVSWGGQK